MVWHIYTPSRRFPISSDRNCHCKTQVATWREVFSLRNAPLAQAPQSILVNRGEYGTQDQLRSDWDRLVAAPADIFLCDLARVPHSLGQVPNHLSHHSGQSPSDTPDSWDNGQPGWAPYHEGLPGGLSIFSSGGPPYDQEEALLVSQEEIPLVCLDPLVVVTQVPWLPRRRPSGPPGPHVSGSWSLPGDLGSQGPPRQTFM